MFAVAGAFLLDLWWEKVGFCLVTYWAEKVFYSGMAE